MTGFVIAQLPTGAGILALCPLPGAGGAVTRDLARIADFAPALVISMTETRERADLGAAELPDRLAALGIGWAPFPVPDFGTPSQDADWGAVSIRAQAVLDAGGRVLVHCRGGLGRSGMAVLRLLVERGEDPDRALARLRAVRPGAVETEAQRIWATSAQR